MIGMAKAIFVVAVVLFVLAAGFSGLPVGGVLALWGCIACVASFVAWCNDW